MADHVRAQVRAAVVTALKEITAFGDRVYPYRVKPLITLPSVVVTTPKDEVDLDSCVFSANGPVDYHVIRLEIAVYTKTADGLDDDLDGYAVSIEQKMLADDTFGGLLNSLQPESAEVVTAGEIEKPAGVLVMVWQAAYRTLRGTPTVAL